MGTRTLVLLRHGQYDPEDDGRLTSLGRDQALHAARTLASMHFDAVWASTLPRARETADIVRAHLVEARGPSRGISRVRHTSILREGLYTKVEGYVISAAERREDRARAEAAFTKFFRASRSDRTELLVCHGNLIRYIVCRTLRLTVDRWLRMTTNHCAVSRVIVRDSGAVRLASYNETLHLPPKLVT